MQRRNFIRLTLGALSILLSGGKQASAKSAADIKGTVKRIAFGSCCEQDNPQPIWKAIGETKPDVFLFIGDNIYADTEDMALMESKYKLLGSKPEYAKFRSEVPVLATWDDHDYGINDGGNEYPKKEESKKLMLDFFEEPKDSERRSRSGIYTSYSLGPKGQNLQIVLLDLRWFRTPLIFDKENGYVPNPDPKATMTGEQQWAWLEEELKKPADLRIIASGIQFASSEHRWEKWANYPADKKRMLDLIDKLKVKNAILISGDMHFAELSAEDTPGGIKLFDLTASGMNIVEPGSQFPNKNRIELYEKTPHFGFIEIDWEKPKVSVDLQIRSDAGATVISKTVSYDRLS